MMEKIDDCLKKLYEIQISKLIDLIYNGDVLSIERLCKQGLNGLINYNEKINGKTALITAVQIGNYDLIEFLLKLGANPDIGDYFLRTPLMFACQLGDSKIVDILCKNNCDVNLIDFEYNSSISYCYISPSERHLECLKRLIHYNADCNKLNNGKSPFLEACEKSKYIENFCITLLNKADFSILNTTNGNQPLHYSAINGTVKLGYHLLKNGSNPNMQNYYGQTPSHLAVQFGNLEFLKLLSSFGANFDKMDKNGDRIINYAFKNFDLNKKKQVFSLIRFLSSRGSRPFDKNSKSKLLSQNLILKKIKILSSKISRKTYKKFKVIRVKNEIPEILTDEYFIFWMIKLNDLVHAVFDLMLSLYESLFDLKPKLSREDFKLFIKRFYIETIPDIVLDKLFDLLAINFHVNKTKLFNLKVYETLSNPKFQLNQGLKLKSKKKSIKLVYLNKNKKTKINTSKIFIPINQTNLKGSNFQFKYFDCIDPLRFDLDRIELKNSWLNDSKWYFVCEEKTKIDFSNLINRGDLKNLDKIISKKSSLEVLNLLNLHDKYYKTPLMIAVINENIQMVNYLLEKNVNVNSTDNFKWTALHHAVYRGNLEIVKLLIEKKAEVNLRTVGGRTPLSLGILMNQKEIVEYLKKNLKRSLKFYSKLS